MSDRRDEALARAEHALREGAAPGPARVERWVAVGDPQAPFERFVAILDHHGLLGDDGWLRRDAGLVSMGDHFDFASRASPDETGREGQRILAWLAAHPRDQVRLLLGNHDAARVIEFGTFSDAEFRTMRAEAEATVASEEDAFALRYGVASAGIVRRDYAAWSEAQRAQVQRLLLAGRYELAIVATHEGAPLLMTHAGVTGRELALAGLPADARAQDVQVALEAHLGAAIERVRQQWQRADHVPLSLESLHVSPAPGQEAGGLLAHRPSNPQRPKVANHAWEWNPERPRRFAIERLPTAFDQVVGHTGRGTLERELFPWNKNLAPHPGPVHTLHFGGGEPCIEPGIAARRSGMARLFLLDPSMSKLTDPAHAQLMPLDGVSARAG